MTQYYPYQLKKEVCIKVCDEKHSTMKVAKEYEIPLKTMEKWITAYNKDSSVFDKEEGYYQKQRKRESRQYDQLDRLELIRMLKKKDREIKKLQKVVLLENRKNSRQIEER